jgi:hypothetical protein
MWYDAWSESRDGVATISAGILRTPTRAIFVEQERWEGYGYAANGAKYWNATTFNLVQVFYFTLSHMRSGLFNSVTYSLKLYKNHRMA